MYRHRRICTRNRLGLQPSTQICGVPRTVQKENVQFAMFGEATSFNVDLSKWDVSSVTDMDGMFLSVRSLNADLSKRDVSSVANMGAMFQEATSLNVDLSKWDVSSVTDMDGMFLSARSLNADLSEVGRTKCAGHVWNVPECKIVPIFILFECTYERPRPPSPPTQLCVCIRACVRACLMCVDVLLFFIIAFLFSCRSSE